MSEEKTVVCTFEFSEEVFDIKDIDTVNMAFESLCGAISNKFMEENKNMKIKIRVYDRNKLRKLNFKHPEKPNAIGVDVQVTL